MQQKQRMAFFFPFYVFEIVYTGSHFITFALTHHHMVLTLTYT